jgi:hypothetical protein
MDTDSCCTNSLPSWPARTAEIVEVPSAGSERFEGTCMVCNAKVRADDTWFQDKSVSVGKVRISINVALSTA